MRIMDFKIELVFLFLIVLLGCKTGKEIVSDQSGLIEINETKLYYNTVGSGDTLIVLHGGPGLSHKYMKPQLDSLLSADFTLLYYDQRGSGWSEGVKDTSRLTMDDYVQDIESLRKHFNLNKINLLGHSFGGLLAMKYGIAFPANLNSIVLVDTDAASYALRTPYQIKMINSRISEAQEAYLDSIASTTAYKNYNPESYNAYYKTFLTSYFANPSDTSALSLGFDSISIPKISVTGKFIRGDLGKYDIHDQLPKIACRTLILQGTESVFSVEGANAIHEKLPNSEIHLFEDCGHFEYIEAPEKFKSLILDFYKKE